ncbi:MAG: polyphosphate polymerase domain-containing protein [Ruminococcus sp.]|nr:polyphosphate polymerase domain-containing protein [Ruminococcus sp.]
MPAFQTVFKRYEKKYRISAQQKQQLLSAISGRIMPDKYGESTVCNIYFDTPDYRLIRTSIEKPVFKEKLRIRSYGTPNADSNVFIELKKKYKGIVYKRRADMTYGEAMRYVQFREHPPGADKQILSEIDYFFRYYGCVVPAVSLFYDRTAFYGADDAELRLTFDTNIRFRSDCDLTKGDYGDVILNSSEFIMEIKCIGAMPLWLTHELDRLKIFPSSFSKYGEAYKLILQSETEKIML